VPSVRARYFDGIDIAGADIEIAGAGADITGAGADMTGAGAEGAGAGGAAGAGDMVITVAPRNSRQLTA
jgi:hypothetical protein